MPETRYIDVYDNEGNLIAQESYEVSDEELEQEATREAAEEAKAKTKFNIFATITAQEAADWIEVGVVDLASAKAALKHLIYFCILLRDRLKALDRG